MRTIRVTFIKADNTAVKIKKAMRANERKVLARVKREPLPLINAQMFMTPAWQNALERLMNKGLVMYSAGHRGYVATAKGKRSR